MSKGRIAFIGVGEVPTGWFPERDEWDMIYDSCTEAIRDSGVDKNEIEGVISVNPMAQPKLQSEIGFGKVPEELGLKGCKDLCIVNAGGATMCNCVRMAEHWVNSNIAKIVLIHAVTKHSGITFQDRTQFFATAGIDLQWEYPFGTSFNAAVAMRLTRVMHDTGLTEEQLAGEVVALRSWAVRDPLSPYYGKPCTIDDVLNSRMVTSPLHQWMCNRLMDGAGAIVATTPEIAKKICKKPVYKLGEGVRYTLASMTQRSSSDLRNTLNRQALDDALTEAGITTKDLACFEHIAVYPGFAPHLLEMVGVCKAGEGGKAVMEGYISHGGRFPISTIGGAMGRGHTGSGPSMAHYIESIRQLTDRAGERQLPDCRYLATWAAGGSGMNTIWTILGRNIL